MHQTGGPEVAFAGLMVETPTFGDWTVHMKRLVGISVLCHRSLTGLNTAAAQTPQPAQQPSAQVEVTRPMRPATTTASGTTGLWFVPTAEVLPTTRNGLCRFYRTNIDDGQGFTDISMFPATFAVGIGDRAEFFGSWALVTRLDRDTRPLFFNRPTGTNAARKARAAASWWTTRFSEQNGSGTSSGTSGSAAR